MEYPLQKLCYLDNVTDLYFAAAGPFIYSVSRQDPGKILSIWPTKGDNGLPDPENGMTAHEDRTGSSPNKRRKLSTGEAAVASSDSSSVEFITERAKGQRRKPKTNTNTCNLPNVSHLTAAKDGRHIIAITAEDKCVRVFELASATENGYHSGMLKLLTERSLPKRLCALVITPDDSTVLVADKSGDVYSLPIHPRKPEPRLPHDPEPPRTSKVQQKPAGDFKPSASELTVHTKGNREALRQQREQRAAAKTKEAPTFEHELLLGHVSLLTDLIMAEAEVAGKRREYILTADRDEHIRVSRGPSQAHIIENYCLGHTEFVSKLCILPWQSDILVSGGGDTTIKTFHWQSGRLAGELSISDILSDAISSSTHDLSEHKPLRKLAVSGIWPMIAKTGSTGVDTKFGFVLIAFEGLPFILSLEWTSAQQLIYHHILELPGNVLDVLVFPETQTILISIDTVHVPGSVKYVRDSAATDSVTKMELRCEQEMGRESGWRWTLCDLPPQKSVLSRVIARELMSRPAEKATYSVLGELLYGLENLRKNRVEEDAVEEPIQEDILSIEGQ